MRVPPLYYYPAVVGVGYRAATAVEDVMGVKISTRAAAFTTADIIRQIQGGGA